MNYIFYADCVGCLMEALTSGEIDQCTYNAIYEQQAEIDKLKREECPKCQQIGYISMYEPDLMHCPACGLYSIRQADTWFPFRQGQVQESESAP